MSVIAGAIVPLLNPSKVKKQNDSIISNHGVAECFYNNDGELYLWTIDNKDNKSGTLDKMAGNSCSISLPKANFYKMTAIGAGGDVESNHNIGFTPATQTKNGSISLDQSFSDDIENAPDFIREKWGTRYAIYTITSPTGAGGDGMKYFVQNISSGDCASCTVMNPSTCPFECYSEQCSSGGDSGWSKTVDVKVPIEVNDKISYISNYQHVKLSVGNKYFQYDASGSGTSAYTDGNTYHNGNNGTDASYTKSSNIYIFGDVKNNIQHLGGECGEPSPNNKYVSNGSISIKHPSDGDIKYQYNVLAANINYYTKAGLGEMRSIVYEKLSNKNLVLTPAKNNDYGNNISKIEIQDNNGNLKTILNANSGADGISDSKSEIIQNSNDLPLPQSLIENIKVDYPSNYVVSTGFKSEIKDQNLTPGKAGYGAYPLIQTLGEGMQNNFKIQKYDGRWDTYTSGISSVSNNKLNCFNDNQEKVFKDGYLYCKGTLGSKGAVIVSW